VLSDEELVQQLSGPEWGLALNTLWDRHKGLFVAIARSSTRSDADCEDLLSETLTRLAERAAVGTLKIETSFRAFVVRTIKNTAMNRQRSRRRIDVDQEPIGTDIADGATTPIDLVVGGVEQQYIAAAFEQLNDNQRDVLYMVEVEGMKPREVAAILGTSANNVSQIAVRARSALREGWVRAHLAGRTHTLPSADCEGILELLPAYVAGNMRADRSAVIETHLAICGSCAQWAADLVDDTVKLRGLFLPLLPLAASTAITGKVGLNLGVAASGLAETVGTVAKKSLWQARRLLTIGVPATVGVGAVVMMSVTGGDTTAAASSYVMSGTSVRTDVRDMSSYVSPDAQRQCTVEQSVTLLNSKIKDGDPINVRIERSGYCGLRYFYASGFYDSPVSGSLEECEAARIEEEQRWSSPVSDPRTWVAGAFLRKEGSTREAPLSTGGIQSPRGVLQLWMSDWSETGFIDFTSEADLSCKVIPSEEILSRIVSHVVALVGEVREAYTLSYEYPHLWNDEEQFETAQGRWELSVGVRGRLGTHFSWQLDNVEQVTDLKGQPVEPWLQLEVTS
jgi:RNA polymerase sigma factor (sigma-70 family)